METLLRGEIKSGVAAQAERMPFARIVNDLLEQGAELLQNDDVRVVYLKGEMLSVKHRYDTFSR